MELKGREVFQREERPSEMEDSLKESLEGK